MIASIIALLAMLLYLYSGKADLDLNKQSLIKSANVDDVKDTGHNSILITCKNGQKYEIFYPAGQTDFKNLVYDKCGG